MNSSSSNTAIVGCTSCAADVNAASAEGMARLDRFSIPNMDCRSEEAAIRDRLGRIDGIQKLDFDLKGRRLVVSHGLDSAQPIMAALHEIGMRASLDGAAPTSEPASTLGTASEPPSRTDEFSIPNMDCRSEEAAIRDRLGRIDGIQQLDFDLKGRRLSVAHGLGSAQPILAALHEIGMNAALGASETPIAEAKTLRLLEPARVPSVVGNTTRLLITNMDCPTEEALIRKRLGAVDGIDSLHFDLINRRLDAQHRLPSPEPILAALKDIGMKAMVEREAVPASAGEAVYLIEKMDCPTEEGLLRKVLEGMAGVLALQFNLMSRTPTVSHDLEHPRRGKRQA